MGDVIFSILMLVNLKIIPSLFSVFLFFFVYMYTCNESMLVCILHISNLRHDASINITVRL